VRSAKGWVVPAREGVVASVSKAADEEGSEDDEDGAGVGWVPVKSVGSFS
jgi:hypothetical protein